MNNLREILMNCVMTENMRKRCVPDSYNVAKEIIENIIQDLGIVEIEAKISYNHATTDNIDDYRSIVSRSLNHAIARKLIETGVNSISIDKNGPPSDMRTARMSTVVITKLHGV